eukprot:scaffold88783_cov69-Phaeocystis_antarctica.AAC.2
MWRSVTERRHRDGSRGTVVRVRPMSVQLMSSLQDVQRMLSLGAAVLLNVPLGQPQSSEYSAPRPSVVEPRGHRVPTTESSGQYSPSWHGSQLRVFAE